MKLSLSYFYVSGRVWEAQSVVFYVSAKLWEAQSVVLYVSGRLREAQSVVFDVSGRLWEAQFVVFYVCWKALGGSICCILRVWEGHNLINLAILRDQVGPPQEFLRRG